MFLLTKVNTQFEFDALAFKVDGDDVTMLCNIVTVLNQRAVDLESGRPLENGKVVRWPNSLVAVPNRPQVPGMQH